MVKEEIIEKQRREEDFYLQHRKMLSNTDSEANRRYAAYENRDPFSEVESALLNSADIFQYVAKTGMIYPFDVSKLSGASYEVAIRGKVIWWDEEKKEQCEKELLKPEDSFELKPNSIAFVTLEPMFRIPDYIALRFNLKIVHVYKGLLLGTGPLVDPGFVGKLSIPLHNLTANTYKFKAGDGIIQMEFTKLSGNNGWTTTKRNRDWLYKKKWIKPGRTVGEYLERSLEGINNKIVRSSIPNELQKIRSEIPQKVEALEADFELFKQGTEEAYEKVKREIKEEHDKFESNIEKNIEKNIKRAQSITVTAVVTLIAFACTAIYQLGTANTIKKERIYELEKAYEQLVEDYDTQKKEIESRLLELEKQFEMKEDEKEVFEEIIEGVSDEE